MIYAIGWSMKSAGIMPRLAYPHFGGDRDAYGPPGTRWVGAARNRVAGRYPKPAIGMMPGLREEQVDRT